MSFSENENDYRKISPAEIIRQEYQGNSEGMASRVLAAHTREHSDNYQNAPDIILTDLDQDVKKHIKSSQYNNLKWDDLLPSTSNSQPRSFDEKEVNQGVSAQRSNPPQQVQQLRQVQQEQTNDQPSSYQHQTQPYQQNQVRPYPQQHRPLPVSNEQSGDTQYQKTIEYVRNDHHEMPLPSPISTDLPPPSFNNYQSTNSTGANQYHINENYPLESSSNPSQLNIENQQIQQEPHYQSHRSISNETSLPYPQPPPHIVSSSREELEVNGSTSTTPASSDHVRYQHQPINSNSLRKESEMKPDRSKIESDDRYHREYFEEQQHSKTPFSSVGTASSTGIERENETVASAPTRIKSSGDNISTHSSKSSNMASSTSSSLSSSFFSKSDALRHQSAPSVLRKSMRELRASNMAIWKEAEVRAATAVKTMNSPMKASDSKSTSSKENKITSSSSASGLGSSSSARSSRGNLLAAYDSIMGAPIQPPSSHTHAPSYQDEILEEDDVSLEGVVGKDQIGKLLMWLTARHSFSASVPPNKQWGVDIVSVLKIHAPYMFRNGDQVVWTDSNTSENILVQFLDYSPSRNPAESLQNVETARISINSGREVKEVLLSELQPGTETFLNGDEVSWVGGFDDGVPRGEVGFVQGYNERGRVRVKFPKGAWNFLPQELRKESDKGISSEALGLVEKVVCELLGRVLTTAALLAAPNTTTSSDFLQAIQLCIPNVARSEDPRNGGIIGARHLERAVKSDQSGLAKMFPLGIISMFSFHHISSSSSQMSNFNSINPTDQNLNITNSNHFQEKKTTNNKDDNDDNDEEEKQEVIESDDTSKIDPLESESAHIEITKAQKILAERFKEAGICKDYRALNDLKSRIKTIESLKAEAIAISRNLKTSEEAEDYELCEVISKRLVEIDKEVASLVEGAPAITSLPNTVVTSTSNTAASTSLNLISSSSNNSALKNNNKIDPTPAINTSSIEVVEHAPGGLSRESILAMFETAKGHREYKKMKILKIMTFQLDEVRTQLTDLKTKLLLSEDKEDFGKCEIISENILKLESKSHNRTIENMKLLEEINKLKIENDLTTSNNLFENDDDHDDGLGGTSAGGYSSTQWGTPIRNSFGDNLLIHFQTTYQEAKAAEVKDYAYLKSLKQQIESQRLLNEKADLLHAELSLAEQSEDFDKCEKIELKLKEIPKTIAEAKAAQLKRTGTNHQQHSSQYLNNDETKQLSKSHTHHNGSNDDDDDDDDDRGTNEMILRMTRDLSSPLRHRQNKPYEEESPSDIGSNDQRQMSDVQQLRNVPIGILGDHKTDFKGQKDGEALLAKLDELIRKVPLEELRMESVERKQNSYSVGDRVVVSLTSELRRPKGEVVYGEDHDGCYSVQLDPDLPFGVLSGRKPIRTSKRRSRSVGRAKDFSDSESGIGDDETSVENRQEFVTVHGSDLALISTPMDELVAMVAVAAHSGKIPTRLITEAKTILRDLVVREQAASDEREAWAELDAEERRLIRKERDARYGGVSLGGGDRSSSARVNARIVSSRDRAVGNAFSGVLEQDRNTRARSTNDVNLRSRTLQRHLSRNSVSSSRVRSSSPRAHNNTSRGYNSQSAPRPLPATSKESSSRKPSAFSNSNLQDLNDYSNDDNYASPNEFSSSSHSRSKRERTRSSTNQQSSNYRGSQSQPRDYHKPSSPTPPLSSPVRSHKSNQRLNDFISGSDDEMMESPQDVLYDPSPNRSRKADRNKESFEQLERKYKI